MSVAAAQMKLLLSAVVPSASPLIGGPRVEVSIDNPPASGNTNGQWALATTLTYTIAASATESVDLKVIPGPSGADIAFVEVGAIAVLHEPASVSSSVDLSPNATNGWTAIFQDASDLTRLLAGQAWVVLDYSGDGAGFAVGASSKVLDIVNNDGANAATVTLAVFGRSA